MMANNVRYLIYPWVRVPHLASHILSLITRLISMDWEEKYGHSVYLIETFVDKKFEGTRHKTANWIKAGSTAGCGRDSGHHNAILPIKDIYLYPLVENLRSMLCGEVRR